MKMNEVEKKVKIGLWRQRIGYGSSDFACNLIWQMISLYLLYFYTNVMHLNAGAVSIMFLVTKFIDGVSDLIVGYLIDKTNTRWGKSRPWILFGAIPFGVTIFYCQHPTQLSTFQWHPFFRRLVKTRMREPFLLPAEPSSPLLVLRL